MPVIYNKVTYNQKDYAVMKVKQKDKFFLSTVDFEDIEKILEKKIWNIRSGYVTNCYIDGTTKKYLGLHSFVMNFIPESGIGSPPKSIDHINRIPCDNRKENLRIFTQSQQMLNQSKRERKIELPEGCGINPQDIPKNIWYVKPNGKHSDRFCVEVKGLPDGKKISQKLGSDKNLSLKMKLEEAKLYLQKVYEEHPFLKSVSSDDGIQHRNELRNSYNEIIKLSGFEQDVINYNLQVLEEYSKKEEDQEIIKEAKQLFTNAGTGKNHKSNLPEGCGVSPNDIPRYCHFEREKENSGCSFVIENHPKLKEIGKRRIFTSSARTKSIKEKFDELLVKLEELENMVVKL